MTVQWLLAAHNARSVSVHLLPVCCCMTDLLWQL